MIIIKASINTPEENRDIEVARISELDPHMNQTIGQIMSSLINVGVPDEGGKLFYPAHTIYKIEHITE